MKSKLREILNRNKGISNEARRRNYMQFIKDWLQYFRLADMKGILRDIDGWSRCRIRTVYWKQWKKIKMRYRMIRRYDIPEWKVHELANPRWLDILAKKEKVNYSHLLQDALKQYLGITSPESLQAYAVHEQRAEYSVKRKK